MRKTYSLIFFIVGTLSASAMGQVQAVPSVSPSGTQTEWTLGKVIAALQWRESIFDNGYMEWNTEMRFKLGTPAKTIKRYRVYFLDKQMHFKDDVFDSDFPTLCAKDAEWSWDGTTCRGLGRSSRGNAIQISGLISNEQPAFLSQIECGPLKDVLAGYRLSEAIKKLVEFPGATVDISVADLNGTRVLTLRVAKPDEGFTINEYEFLPEKDFLLKRSSFRIYASIKRDVVTFERTEDMSEIKQLHAVWLASKCESHKRLDQSSNYFNSSLVDWTPQRPTTEQMTISFPPQTMVNDRVERTYYEVQPDGTKRYMDYFDTDTGRTVKAGPPSTRPLP